MALKCIQHIMKANLGEQDESWFEKTTGILIILINRYIDKPTLASETHLASLKTKFDKLVVDEIKIHSADLSRLSHVLDNGVFKKLCMINWLTKSILLMLRCQKLVDVNKKLDVKKKRLDTSGLLKMANYSTKLQRLKARCLVLLVWYNLQYCWKLIW